jgi:hypothetical protein
MTIRVKCYPYANSNGGYAMSTFVMLTRLSHVALKSPGKLEELERQVMERIRAKCPDVEWLSSFAVCPDRGLGGHRMGALQGSDPGSPRGGLNGALI